MALTSQAMLDMMNFGAKCEADGCLHLAMNWYELAAAHGHAQAASRLGDLQENLGNIALAIDYYNSAVNLNPDDADAMCSVGRLLKRQGDLGGAVDMFDRGHKAGHAESTCELAVLYEQQGDPNTAKDLLLRLLGQGYAPAAADLGRLYEREDDEDKAVHYYQVGRAMGDGRSASHLGQVYEYNGDAATAQLLYAEAHELGYD